MRGLGRMMVGPQWVDVEDFAVVAALFGAPVSRLSAMLGCEPSYIESLIDQQKSKEALAVARHKYAGQMGAQ